MKSVMDLTTIANDCFMCDGSSVTRTPSYGVKLELGANPVAPTSTPEMKV